MHHARAFIHTSQDQFLAARKQQLAGHRINTIIRRRDHHPLAGLETIRVVEDFIGKIGRRGLARDLQRLLGAHDIRGAMPEPQDPGEPGRYGRVFVHQR